MTKNNSNKNKELVVSKIVSGDVLCNKIYTIRGRKVMLDYDLAEIYGYETKVFNRQVKRNIEKFEGEDFMFQLTKEEIANSVRCQNGTSRKEKPFDLICQNGTSSFVGAQNVTSRTERLFQGQVGGGRYLPYAFTEQGIYMLMTVLRGELAIKQSRALVMAFKAMKDYIVGNQERMEYRESLQLALKVASNSEDIIAIKSELEKISSQNKTMSGHMKDYVRRSEISPILLDFHEAIKRKEYIFMDGQLVEADAAYTELYKKAKKSIHIIDDYVSVKTLKHLCSVKLGVKVVIFSDNLGKYLHKLDCLDFRKERPDVEIQFIRNNRMIHDRFVIVDYGLKGEVIYHCGASEKDVGKRMAVIGKYEDDFMRKVAHEVVRRSMKNPELSLE